MAKINLRDYYPFCNHDIFLDIPDEVATCWKLNGRKKRIGGVCTAIRHSIPLTGAMGLSMTFASYLCPPSEVYERKITAQQLHAAITALPDKQGKRIYSHYVLGISKSDIARAEGVSENNIRKSISQGLRNMEIFLRNDSV